MTSSLKAKHLGWAAGAAAALAMAGAAFAAAGDAGSPSDPAVERTRQEVKMLDDLFKNMVVWVDEHYVKKPSDTAAATAAKALFGAMKKSGWYEVRILGLTDVIGDPDDIPRDEFEKTAAKKLRGGDAYYEELVVRDGKRYLRAATGIPVVSENCVMCHANFKGDKGNIGALAYDMPVLE
jgi:hypothetical protein